MNEENKPMSFRDIHNRCIGRDYDEIGEREDNPVQLADCLPELKEISRLARQQLVDKIEGLIIDSGDTRPGGDSPDNRSSHLQAESMVDTVRKKMADQLFYGRD